MLMNGVESQDLTSIYILLHLLLKSMALCMWSKGGEPADVESALIKKIIQYDILMQFRD